MAIVCEPSTAPNTPHSTPERVRKTQDAVFMVPLRRTVPVGSEEVVLRFEIDPGIDLFFANGTKVLEARHTVTPLCVVTPTAYSLAGSFRGGTFVRFFVDSTPETSIRVDVD